MTTKCYGFVLFCFFCNSLLASVSFPVHKVAQKSRHTKTGLLILTKYLSLWYRLSEFHITILLKFSQRINQPQIVFREAYLVSHLRRAQVLFIRW